MTRPDGFSQFRESSRPAASRLPDWRDAAADDFHATWIDHLRRTEDLGSFRSRLLTALAQSNLLRLARPYVKVHAGMAAMLATTGIEPAAA